MANYEKNLCGIREILNILENDEIIQLASTTCQNLIKHENIRTKDGTLWVFFFVFIENIIVTMTIYY